MPDEREPYVLVHHRSPREQRKAAKVVLTSVPPALLSIGRADPSSGNNGKRKLLKPRRQPRSRETAAEGNEYELLYERDRS